MTKFILYFELKLTHQIYEIAFAIMIKIGQIIRKFGEIIPYSDLGIFTYMAVYPDKRAILFVLRQL